MIRLWRLSDPSPALFLHAIVDCAQHDEVADMELQWAKGLEDEVLIHRDVERLLETTDIEALHSEPNVSKILPTVRYCEISAVVILPHYTKQEPDEISCRVYLAPPGQQVLGRYDVSELPSVLGDSVARHFRKVQGTLVLERI